MAQPYPLYDDLKRQVEARLEKSIDIQRVCNTINNLTQTLPATEANAHFREIGALILHHEFVANSGVLLSNTPFGGRCMTGGRGVLYTMKDLPPLLQQIIAQYVETNSQ